MTACWSGTHLISRELAVARTRDKRHGNLHTKAVNTANTPGKQQDKWQTLLIFSGLYIFLYNLFFTTSKNCSLKQLLLTRNTVYQGFKRKTTTTTNTTVNANHCGQLSIQLDAPRVPSLLSNLFDSLCHDRCNKKMNHSLSQL